MKAMKILITLLSVLGGVALVAGALTFWLTAYTGDEDFIAFPIVCFIVGVLALAASGIVRSIYNRKRRNGDYPVTTVRRSAPPPPAGAYSDPFGEFPDATHKRNIDPFGFDAPKAKPKDTEEAPVAPQPTTRDKFCEHCGAPRTGTDKFCPFCGHKYDNK